MGFESNRDQTYPHDYRLICAGREAPTVVGGQAINLWAISYRRERRSPQRFGRCLLPRPLGRHHEWECEN